MPPPERHPATSWRPDVLDLTLAIDHNVVDGAPAARFGAEFRALLESAAVISPSS